MTSPPPDPPWLAPLAFVLFALVAAWVVPPVVAWLVGGYP